jgi:heme-degrading monooxygenase HmoA
METHGAIDFPGRPQTTRAKKEENHLQSILIIINIDRFVQENYERVSEENMEVSQTPHEYQGGQTERPALLDSYHSFLSREGYDPLYHSSSYCVQRHLLIQREELMFVMMNRMTVLDSDKEHFEELFRTRAKAVDRRPGFIKAEILRPTKGNTYVVMTHWKDKESFQGWVKSSEYKEGHTRVDDFRGEDGKMRLTSQVEMYEVFTE